MFGVKKFVTVFARLCYFIIINKDFEEQLFVFSSKSNLERKRDNITLQNAPC